LDIAEMMKESGETRLLIIFAFAFANVFRIALNTNTNVKIIVMHYIMNNVSAHCTLHISAQYADIMLCYADNW
jgi:hypothetical protein